jgi:hypothetical protein
MAITLGRFQNLFMRMGKIIAMSQVAGPVITNLQTAQMGLVNQQSQVSANPLSNEFAVNINVVNPLGGQVNATINNIAQLPIYCLAAITTYLQKYISVELGLAANATMADVGTALIAQMATATASVAPEANNPTGFAAYFDTQLSIILPVNVSPTIPDTFITESVLTDATG